MPIARLRSRGSNSCDAGLLLTDARLSLAERRRARARSSLRAAKAIVDTYPDVGARIRAQIAQLTIDVASTTDAGRRGSTPTEAELRVLAELARTSSRARARAAGARRCGRRRPRAGGRRARRRRARAVIVRAKLAVPGRRPGLVERGRLHRALDASAAGRLTVVQAPAGYGKTTAVASWLHAGGRPACWVTLDRHDNDPRRLVAHLLAAVAAVLPAGALGAAQRALDGGSDLQLTVLPQLAAALGDGAPERLTLVLDDLHVLSDEPARAAVRTLLDLLPDSTHLVVTTRTRPALRLARRVAAREATVIGVEQLAFAREEAGALLRGALDREPAREDVDHAVARLHGWPTGLSLLAAALEIGGARAGSGVVDVLGSLTRGELVDYVVEETLAAGDPVQRRLLLHTSVLPSFDGSLAAAVTGDAGAHELVERLRDEGQFVVADAEVGGWVRVHDVIREALQVALQRSEPGVEPILRAGAAAWFERHGMIAEAIAQAVAGGDREQLAGLICEHGLALALARRTTVLRPAVDVLRASAEREPLLAGIELLLRVQEGVDPRVLAPEAWRLYERCGDLAGARMLMALLLASPIFGDVKRSIAVGLESLERFGDVPLFAARLAPAMAITLLWDEGFDEARAFAEQGIGSGRLPAEIFGHAVLSALSRMQDDAVAGERHARCAIDLLESSGLETAVEFWGVRGLVADALRLAGRLDEARAHLDMSLDLQRRRPGTVVHGALLLTDTRLAVAERRRARARASLRAAAAIFDGFPDVGARMRAQVALLSAELATPTDVARRGSTPTEAELRVLAGSRAGPAARRSRPGWAVAGCPVCGSGAGLIATLPTPAGTGKGEVRVKSGRRRRARSGLRAPTSGRIDRPVRGSSPAGRRRSRDDGRRRRHVAQQRHLAERVAGAERAQ
jgi:LuxR family maltose regulon positive regulatory protein